MKRLCRALLLIAAAISILTGCWNRRELNTLAIQLATSIDKVGDQYQIAVQVVDPSAVAMKSQGSQRAPVILYKTTAQSVFEAFRKLTEIAPRKVYGSHVRVIVFGEAAAREGIGKTLDLLSRDQEMRTDFYMMVARETEAANVLSVITALEKIPANKLYSALESSSKAWAPTTTFTLDQFINSLVAEGKNPVLTGVVINGNLAVGKKKENVEQILPGASLQYSDLAIFRKDKLIGWLNQEESKGYNYIMNNVKSTVGHLTCPDGGKVDIEAIRSKSKVKGRMENGEPVIDITVNGESNIGEVECGIDIEEPQTIMALQKQANEKLVNTMRNVVEVMQTKHKVDIFGFGQAIYRADPKAWKEIKSDWPELFTRLKVNYKASIKIRKIGTTGNSFLKDIKE